MGQVIQKLTEAAGKKLGLKNIQEIGIGGFVLFAEVKQQVEFSSTVPVYPLEDGSFASDNIINNPTPIKIEGVVADKFERFNPVIEQYKRLQAEIGSVTKYLPGRTTAQLTKVAGFANSVADITRKIDTAVEDGEQAFNFFGDKSPGTRSLREQFYLTMKELHDSKQLISIQGEFQIFENYRITSLVMSTDNEEENVTFQMTAQEVRFAQTLFSDVTAFFKKPSLGNKGATDGIADKGKQAGIPTERSLLTILGS